jgi:nitroimidazol reductase NimA-like FMN-containing flavoprotein (pyridoxamine 5'-phosphate oxidase superfamily)
MLYVRIDDSLYLHGSVGSRLLKHLTGGHPCCLTVTHIDGLVLARSQFSHSANYRSVAVFGRARALTDLADKARAMTALIDALVPGRGRDARPGDAQELAGTTVLEVAIEQLSVKVRSGPPGDLDADLGLPVWAGVLPLETRIGRPLQDSTQDSTIGLPDYLKGLGEAG